MLVKTVVPSHARNLTNNFVEEGSIVIDDDGDNEGIVEEIHDDDDDGVILTSYRGYEKPQPKKSRAKAGSQVNDQDN